MRVDVLEARPEYGARFGKIVGIRSVWYAPTVNSVPGRTPRGTIRYGSKK